MREYIYIYIYMKTCGKYKIMINIFSKKKKRDFCNNFPRKKKVFCNIYIYIYIFFFPRRKDLES